MFIPVPQRINNKLSEDFYPLQKEELIALRKAKLINNAAYIHLALRYENPFCDRPVQIIPKEFALRWRIPEVSVYKAIARLKELGILNIKSGKLIIDWIIKPSGSPELNSGACLTARNAPENKTANVEPETVTEAISVNELSDPKENYQIREKIIRSDNGLSNPRKNYQIRENRGLKSLSDISSSIPQTLQTSQTNQTGGGQEKNSDEETVQKLVRTSEVEEDLTSDIWADSVEIKVPAQVTQQVEEIQQKTKIISPSKKRCDPADVSSAKERAPRQSAQKNTAIPNDLRERLEELEISLDKKVLKAIASHDISQAYGACTHVENTRETITNPRGVFLYQLPKQPIEKLGSRYSEELLNNIKAQNQAIEEERKDPEYHKRSKELFAQARAKLKERKNQ
ncbi:MAG: hypothetical protein WBM44_17770, partial [Waterburya sp.]